NEGDPAKCVSDADGDGYAPIAEDGTDCDDLDARTRPGAASRESFACTLDADGDGFGATGAGDGFGTDCDDANPDVHPDRFDPPDDGVDGDCAGGDPSARAGGYHLSGTDPACDDEGPGASEQPFCTFEAAMRAVQVSALTSLAPVQLFVAEGDYDASATVELN